MINRRWLIIMGLIGTTLNASDEGENICSLTSATISAATPSDMSGRCTPPNQTGEKACINMLRSSEAGKAYFELQQILCLEEQLTELQQKHAYCNQEINALNEFLVNISIQIQVSEYAAEEAELNAQLEPAQEALSQSEELNFTLCEKMQALKEDLKKAEEAFNNGEPVNFEHLHRSGAARALDYSDSDSE